MTEIYGYDKKTIVKFEPDPKLTSQMIGDLNHSVSVMPPQIYASYSASTVAGIAFMLRSNNDRELIKQLFISIVDQACDKFEERERLIEEMEKGVTNGRHT